MFFVSKGSSQICAKLGSTCLQNLGLASVRAMMCGNKFALRSSTCSSMNLSGVNVSTFPNQSSKCSLFPALFFEKLLSLFSLL